MITYDEAKDLVLKRLNEYQKSFNSISITLMLIEEDTRVFSFGWVFFYTSKEFYETGNMEYAIGGNGPLIVNRETGVIKNTGTGQPIEYYIEKYLVGEDW